MNFSGGGNPVLALKNQMAGAGGGYRLQVGVNQASKPARQQSKQRKQESKQASEQTSFESPASQRYILNRDLASTQPKAGAGGNGHIWDIWKEWVCSCALSYACACSCACVARVYSRASASACTHRA